MIAQFTSFLGLLLFGITFLTAPCSGADVLEPDRLKELRKMWQTALEKGRMSTYKLYEKDLAKIRKKLEQKGNLEGLMVIDLEKKVTLAMMTGPVKVPEWEDDGEEPLRYIQAARKEFQGKMLKMIAARNSVYQRELDKLKRKYGGNKDPLALDAVEAELVTLQKVIAEAKPAEEEIEIIKPKNKAELAKFLPEKTWKLVGTDRKPARDDLSFSGDGTVTMPWHGCTWEVTGKREVKMTDGGGKWFFMIEFSSDFKKCEVLRSDNGRVEWVGRR